MARRDGWLRAAVAGGAAAEQPGVGRVADDLPKAFGGSAGPVAGDQRHFGALTAQSGQRPFDEAFRTAERVVALPNDGDLH